MDSLLEEFIKLDSPNRLLLMPNIVQKSLELFKINTEIKETINSQEKREIMDPIKKQLDFQAEIVEKPKIIPKRQMYTEEIKQKNSETSFKVNTCNNSKVAEEKKNLPKKPDVGTIREWISYDKYNTKEQVDKAKKKYK